jgi:hypothetical protein
VSATKEQIDEQLRSAHEECGLADVREAYRERLRSLRASDENAFRQATEHYEREIVPRILSGHDTIDGWIAYGARLCELTGQGRLVGVDESGRARPYEAPYQAGTLVLFVPGEKGGDVLAAAIPRVMTPAQQATVTLLVDRKLALPG